MLAQIIVFSVIKVKVIEYLEQTDRPFVSFEIIPPTRGGNAQDLLSLIDDLSKYRPPFVDVTSHASEVTYEELPDGGIKRRIKRKRPGTLGVCAIIQHKYKIEAVPHVLCRGFTKEETEDFLIDLKYLGIQNVLAIQGDNHAYQKPVGHNGRSINEFATNLVEQIANMNNGIYLDDEILDPEASNFCVGVAGYPEKHFEAPNLTMDINHTKQKVEAGGDYIVTQMFYNNKVYFNYVELCKKIGINVPIIPGLKILTKKFQLRSVPSRFMLDIPVELTEQVMKASEDEILDIGINWALKQVEELIQFGVPGLHFYVINDSSAISLLMEKLSNKLSIL
ncbi:MAG: methylenetetrahydrofolate reductase [Candidatus Heimdallarchaeota archaeon]